MGLRIGMRGPYGFMVSWGRFELVLYPLRRPRYWKPRWMRSAIGELEDEEYGIGRVEGVGWYGGPFEVYWRNCDE